MEMLSTTEYNEMERLLGGADAPETVMTVPMACGFIHGIVITPVLQPPSNWLPVIYGGNLPDGEEDDLLDLVNFFNTIYNSYLKKFHNDHLVFPFSYDNLKPDQIDAIQEWIIGLHEALKDHYHIWMQEENPFIHNEDEKDISLCLFYIHSLAWPDEVKKTLAEGDSFDPTDDETVINILSAVPSIVEMLTRYGRELDRKRSKAMSSGVQLDVSPTGRIGRNDPCPCGSGKKYKKCCGRGGA